MKLSIVKVGFEETIQNKISVIAIIEA